MLTKSDGRYRLSLQWLERGAQVRRSVNLYRVAKPEVDRLAAETEEVANLGIEEAGQRILLYKREGGEALYDNALTGEFTNMHWTSLGKTILTHLPNQRVDQIIEEHGLPRATEQTITNAKNMHQERNQIRDQEYAIEDKERVNRVRSVAVPIIQDGQICGAISVTGPKARLGIKRIENELLEQLEQTRDVIELILKHY